MKHHTKMKGDCAVAKVIADLTCKGYDILTPLISEHLPFDLIAYKNGKCKRIQVKHRNGYGVLGYKYKDADFDYYALYLANIDKIIYPSIKFKSKTITSILPNAATPFYWWEDFLEFTDSTTKRTLKDFNRNIIRSSSVRLESRKVSRPKIEELLRLLNKYTYIKVGKRFGVSDNAVRKWVKSYGYNPSSLEKL